MNPKRYIRLNPLTALPTVSELKKVLAEAENAKGSTVEQPWHAARSQKSFSLTVRAELAGGEPIWTLYEGEGNNSQIIWSSPFRDLELLHDVVNLSLPEDQAEKKVGTQKNAETQKKPFDNIKGKPAPERQPGTAKPAEQAPPGRAPEKPKPAAARSASPAGATNAPPAQAPPYPYPAPPPPGYYPPGFVPIPYQQPLPPGYAYPIPYAPGYTLPPAPPLPTGPNGQPLYPPNYYPGYPYPPGYLPYPYGAPPPDPLSKAGTVPLNPGPPQNLVGEPPAPALKTDPELLKKASNILLGHFLVESGLMPERTLLAALRLQELVRRGFLSSSQAAEAVRRSHQRGGAGDPDWEKLKADMTKLEINAAGPPLGQILVEAGLISSIVLKAALKLQEVVRSGAMSKEDACKALYGEYFGTRSEGTSEDAEDDSPQATRVIRLLIKAGIINDQDVIRAKNIRQKHGGKVSKILIATGKIEPKTFEAAAECDALLSADKIKVEKAMIALHYCQRSRVSFKEAVKELGW